MTLNSNSTKRILFTCLIVLGTMGVANGQNNNKQAIDEYTRAMQAYSASMQAHAEMIRA